MRRMLEVTRVVQPGAFLLIRVEAEGVRLEEVHPAEVDPERVEARMKEHVLLRLLARRFICPPEGPGGAGCN